MRVGRPSGVQVSKSRLLLRLGPKMIHSVGCMRDVVSIMDLPVALAASAA